MQSRLTDRARLERECRALCAYLFDDEPSEYLIDRYVGYFAPRETSAPGAFDRALLDLATSGRVGARLADAYSVIFARTSPVREKLVVMLALYECTPAAERGVDAPDMKSVPGFILAGAARAGVFAAALLATTSTLGPLQLLDRVAGGRRER